MSTFVPIGKIHSAQGLRGELFVQVFAGEAAWVDQWDCLQWGERGGDSPLGEQKILKKRVHEKQKKWGFAVLLENVQDRNQAEQWVGRTVFIPETYLVSEEGEAIYLREVLGFRVIDQERGDVGEVIGFSGTSFQDLLVIKNDQGSYEVPFVHPIHLETRKDSKELIMDIPQGLVAGEEL